MSISKAALLFRSSNHSWNHLRLFGSTTSDGSIMKAWVRITIMDAFRKHDFIYCDQPILQPLSHRPQEKSCYRDFDFTIAESATVYDAVQKFAAYDVGALLTVDNKGECLQYIWTSLLTKN